MNKQDKNQKTLTDTDNSLVVSMGEGGLKGIKYMVTEGALTLGGGHTMQYINDVLQFCTLEIYIIYQYHPSKFNKNVNYGFEVNLIKKNYHSFLE